MNLCRGCGEDFGSVWAFDRHRVGVHAYTFREGLDMVPPVEDGRRCVDVNELRDAGWSRDNHGRWRTPVGSRLRTRGSQIGGITESASQPESISGDGLAVS